MNNFLNNSDENIKTIDILAHLMININKIFFITLIFTALSISFYIFFGNEKFTANSIIQKTIYSPGSQSNASSPLSSLAALGGLH